ncbi:MAG: MFS transporter, partial [Dysgonamonadaceae bacterium]|nr:MFS transporter [Dysgonamonadaceae bacterium]
MEKSKSRAWTWIPSLYLAEGLPYVAVMTISVIMYKRMGISNADIALYTSWLYLPWVIKPFWSPFVDILKTKRWWIVTMQLLIGAGFGGIALTIPVPFFFQATLAFFWLLAFSSATHDIAADGFYMLGLDTNQQAAYVGIRSTFYRIATIMGQGFLIILAGFLETTTGREPVNISINASPTYEQVALQLNDSLSYTELNGDLRFVTDNASLLMSTQTRDKDSVKQFIEAVKTANYDNGFTLREDKGKTKEKKEGAWMTHVSKPLGEWIKTNFGEKHNTPAELSDKVGNVVVVPLRLSKRPDAKKEIV